VLVHQAYRFEIDPNNHLRSALASHVGAARFAYNTMLAYVSWALSARAFELRTTGVARTQVPWSLPALRRVWNRELKAWAAPWWPENSKEAYSSGLDALARGLEAFAKSRRGERAGKRIGFPRFKARGAHGGFRVTTGSFGVVDSRHLRLPRIGVIRTREPTGKLLAGIAAGSTRVLSATVSDRAGRWYVSFTCELRRDEHRPANPHHVAGIDVGVKSLAVVAVVGPNAQTKTRQVPNPLALARYQRRVGRLQRELSRRQLGSKRRARTRARLARCHAKVANIRTDGLHKATTSLAQNYATVVVEDLNVSGLVARATGSGRRRAKAGLNRAVLDASPAELRRQLSYKTRWHGGRLLTADRWYPSSKTCSRCRSVKAKLALRERTFRCEQCHLVLDRDANAARNLAGLVTSIGTGSGPGTGLGDEANARGEERLQAGPSGRCSSANREGGTGETGQDRHLLFAGRGCPR
jgi:putative transposase